MPYGLPVRINERQGRQGIGPGPRIRIARIQVTHGAQDDWIQWPRGNHCHAYRLLPNLRVRIAQTPGQRRQLGHNRGPKLPAERVMVGPLGIFREAGQQVQDARPVEIHVQGQMGEEGHRRDRRWSALPC